MPRLPDVFDYGSRPSMRSNRIDAPDQSGLIMAESFENAANVFTRLAGEKKAKDDRLNYALAKNEILQADIAQREKLRDDEDWATYDERYTMGFNTSRDDVVGRYNLSSSDSALLSAESDLLRERGRINVANSAREVEIDEKAATLDSQLLSFRETVLISDPATANDQMLSALEAINAAKDEFLDDEAALSMSQKFVQDVASARLVGMDPKTREQELERSLAARSANGPISAEDIAAEKGTGSIADFLTADVVTKMLKTTRDENEIDLEYETAITLRDEAMAMFPDDSKAMMRHIREQSKGMEAKTRARAEQFGRQIAEERRVAESNERNDIMISAGELLGQTDEDGSFLHGVEDLPREQLAKLSPAQRAQLDAYEGQLRNDSQFADFTNWHSEKRDENGDLVKPAYSTWTNMTPEQKAKTDLTNPIWYGNFERGVWKQMSDEQDRLKGSSADKEKSIQTNDQILTDVWAGELGMPRTGRDDDEEQNYYIARSKLASRIDAESDANYGGQAVPDDVRKKLAREILAEQVWVRDQGLIMGNVFHMDGDKPVSVATVDPDDYRDYYVPIERWRNLKTTVRIGQNAERVEMSWEEMLTNMASTELDGRVPTQKDLENAYAQIIIGGEPAIVQQRVLKALSGGHEY